MRTIKVYTGTPIASVTVQAQPWDKGHVARVASARTCQPITSFSFRLPSKEHIVLSD